MCRLVCGITIPWMVMIATCARLTVRHT